MPGPSNRHFEPIRRRLPPRSTLLPVLLVVVIALCPILLGDRRTRAGTPVWLPEILIQQSTDQPSSAPPRRVIGYLPCWARAAGYSVADVDFTVVTHVADFGALPDERGDLAFSHCQGVQLDSAFVDAVHRGGAKIILVVGGAHSGDAFALMAASATTRANFVQRLASVVTTFGYDGVDIDWETPNSDTDRLSINALVQELRTALGADRSISLAISPWPSHGGQWVDVETLSPLVDWFGMMTYDFHGPGWSGHSGHNAQVFASDVEFTLHGVETPSVDAARLYYVSRGVPGSQLLIGLPFYGYRFHGVTEPGQPLASTDGGQVEFNDIAPLIGNGWTLYRDSLALVPYLSGPGFISFDDPSSIQMKCAYVQHNELGGAIIWALHQDVEVGRPLLAAARDCR